MRWERQDTLFLMVFAIAVSLLWFGFSVATVAIILGWYAGRFSKDTRP
jgi:hypothetical protein